MTNSNFLNGALAFRIWRFDGCCEILGKFQYQNDADAFCEMLVARDVESKANDDGRYFYLAVCETQVYAKAFGAKMPEVRS